MKDFICVGVAGGSGSGKTTIARRLLESFSPGEAVLIEQDAYYFNMGHLDIQERAKLNFDHPDAIDFNLIKEHLLKLKAGETIESPIYDFTTHSRKKDKKKINSAKIIIVEGILILAIKEIRELFDMKIFVDTDPDEMLLRRIERDISERGRIFSSVKTQYLSTVKPMYLEFCEPSKRYADIIVPRGGKNKIAIDMILAKLKRDLQN